MDSVCFVMRKIILICIHIWLDKTRLHRNTASIWVQPRFLVRSVLLIFLFTFLCCVCLFNVLIVCLSSSGLLCAECCGCLWIVHLWLFLRVSLSFIYMHMIMPDAILCFWCWVQEYIYNVFSLHLSSSLFELMIYW